MGVDGTNMLVIIGPSATLDIIENNGIILSAEELNHDSNLMYLAENYFGDNCTIERTPKMLKDNGKRTSNCLKINFNYRNVEPDDYLMLLLQKYKDCWIKNEYINEIGSCGIWIGEYVNNEIKTQIVEWYESISNQMNGCPFND